MIALYCDVLCFQLTKMKCIFKQNAIKLSGLVWMPGLFFFSGVSLKTFKPNMSCPGAALMVFKDFGWRNSLFLPLRSFSFMCFLLVPSFFNAVMSRQCSHLMDLIQMDSTPVKSYSNLSVKHCKNGLFGKQQMDGATAFSSGAPCCIQHSVTDTWCQHWGIFPEHL